MYPAGIYLLKVNKRNTRTRCEICSKVNKRLAWFWYLYYYLWTYFTPCSSVFLVSFEQVNASRVRVTESIFYSPWNLLITRLANVKVPQQSIESNWSESFRLLKDIHPANIYLLKVNNRNTRKRSEICSKLTIKTLERRQWHLFLVFLLMTLSISWVTISMLLLISRKYWPGTLMINPLNASVAFR